MFIKAYLLFFLIVLCVVSVQAQQINGSIKNTFNKEIPRANLLIKKELGSASISEFFTADETGEFSFTLKKEYKNVIYILANVLNYEKAIDSIVAPKIDHIYTFNFTLFPKITALDEVVIAERKRFEIKEDTVVFNPEAYTDGTERKVEDLIKKLPGMEVSEDGTIKYRGKEVLELQLDGDDLFGANYAIAIKNISSDMVEQVEAIDHYSKNPLLKGIENSDNVAVNLKLKKGKVDYSGTADIGYGYGNKPYYNIASTVLGIAKKMKSFGVLSFNTIGLNKTSFDYFSNTSTIEDIANEDLYSKKKIDQTPINSVLGSGRTRVNKEWSVNYNAIYRVSPKLSMKSNIFYVKDEFFRREVYQNEYKIGNEIISYADQTDITKVPENKRLDLKLTYNLSKKSLVELETSISDEQIVADNKLTRNLETTAATTLQSDDFFWKNKLTATAKLRPSLVMQFTSLYARNNAPQEFDIIGNFLSDEDIVNTYDQLSEFRKESFQNHFKVLGKRNNFKYTLTTGLHHYESPFQSSLLENKETVLGFKNDLLYQNTTYFSKFLLAYVRKKVEVESSLGMQYVSQRLEDNLDNAESKAKQDFYPKPYIRATYQLNPVTKVGFTGEYTQKTPQENFLFVNKVVTGNRSVNNNVLSLHLEEEQKYTASYKLNDLFKNIETNFYINYKIRKNVLLSNIEINPNFVSTTYFRSPVAIDDWFFIGSVKRYVRFLRTTIKLSSRYSISNFKNTINQSEIRDGKSKSYYGNIFAKTAFRIPINFENNISYTISSFDIVGGADNTNYTLTNTFKTIVKPNKNWIFTLFHYYFKPNTENSQDFSFLDFSVRYRPSKIKWISGRFIGRNLLDNRIFEQIENSDFSTTVYQSNLISRYFMLSLDMSF